MQFSAFHVAFEDQVDLPTEGVILGQTVSVTTIDHDGNSRRAELLQPVGVPVIRRITSFRFACRLC